MPTLTDLRKALFVAADAASLTPLFGWSGVSYTRRSFVSGSGYLELQVYAQADDHVTPICTVDDISFITGDTTYDVTIQADDATTSYFSWTAGDTTVFGSSGGTDVPVGADLIDIQFDDFGPLDYTAVDDQWHVDGTTTLPAGYATTTSIIFAGVRFTPYYGPWITPPTATVSWDYAGATHQPTAEVTEGSLAPGATYAALCEATTFGSAGNTFAWAHDTDSLGGPVVRQSLVAFPLDDILPSFSDYTPSLPPGAVGVNYESDGLAPQQRITTMVPVVPLSVQNLTDLPMRVQARAQTTPPTITSGITYIPGATLATLPDAGHLDVPVATSSTGVTLTATVPGSVVAPGSPGHYFGTVLLHFDGQISHVGPTVDQWLFQLFGDMTVDVDYQPRRYRFVYNRSLPPLRQYPRDDALGGAPRQGHVNQPKSTQASARQGWTNAYR